MKHLFRIGGMHCPSCEMSVSERLNNIPGCNVESISHTTGRCKIDYTHADTVLIESAVQQLGYTLLRDEKQQSWTTREWITKIAWLVFAGVLLFFFMKSNVHTLIPEYTNLSLTIAFLLGLVASLSTCLAVTGGVIIGYAESVHTNNNIGTQIKFHTGRLLAFIGGGAILGLIGSAFGWSVRFNAVFSILVGVVLLYLGLQLLGFVPSITQWGFHLPRGLSQTIFRFKDPKYASIVGALTFLLPCGFTQSMQLFALQSGDPLQGALVMGAFAFGTLPVLFTLGVGTTYIKDKVAYVHALIASILVVFGLYTVFNGVALVKAIYPTHTTTKNVLLQHVATETIHVGHDGTQFIPSSIVLAVGKNYAVVVTPSSNGVGCMSHVVIPGKGSQAIQQGVPFTIDVDGSTQKKIPLVCSSMGMTQGEIVVQ